MAPGITMIAVISMAAVTMYVIFEPHQIRSLMGRHQANVRIPDPGKVLGSWLEIQLTQHAVTAGIVVAHLVDDRILVDDAAEIDRACGASRLAGGDHVAIPDRASALFAGRDLGGFDALNAVGAFLHHTAAADRHLGVHHQRLELAISRFDRSGIGIQAVPDADLLVVVEVIESPYLERTVVGAVTGPDATVVRHRIDPFLGMNRGSDRANLFTGSRFAVHAGHRLLHDVGVFLVSLEIAVDTQPVHLTTIEHLFTTNNRDIVLALTGDHAGIAADAFGEINCHAPLGYVVALFFVLRLDHLHRLLPQ